MSRSSSSSWGFSSGGGGWEERGACVGQDPRWWDIPEGAQRTRAWRLDNEQAKRICRACPVKVQCRDRAYERREVGVIRAGERMPESSMAWTRLLRQREINARFAGEVGK